MLASEDPAATVQHRVAGPAPSRRGRGSINAARSPLDRFVGAARVLGAVEASTAPGDATQSAPAAGRGPGRRVRGIGSASGAHRTRRTLGGGCHGVRDASRVSNPTSRTL